MKMNLIKARAELNRLPKRLYFNELMNALAKIREKYGVDTYNSNATFCGRVNGVLAEIVGNPKFVEFEIIWHDADWIAKKLPKQTNCSDWKRYKNKNLYIKHFSNGDKLYRSYSTIIGYFNAEKCRLYEDANDYSTTTQRHKSGMWCDCNPRDVEYYGGRLVL